MNKLRKISRKYYLRQIVACWMIYSLLFFIPVRIAMAEVVMTSNPVGTVTVTPLGGGTTQDMTATHGAIGNFSDFDIAGGHTVTCVQGAPTNMALFRVNGNGTEIYGTFTSDGRIFLIDPAGILIGGGATISMNQLVASSLDITNEAFTNGLATGSFQFTGGGLEETGNVTNEGSITAERIALIGRNVFNYGTLTADKYVVMAAGDELLLSENGTVAVDITSFAGWNPGEYSIYQVRHEDGEIDVDGETASVVLAAGDVWSMAYIGAYSNGGSVAVATVGISTDGAGDVTITDDIEAEAVGSGDNAIAAVTISAGSDIEVRPDSHDDATVRAIAEDGINNIADILVEAEGDIKVKAEDGSQAEIEAIAKDGTNNVAIVDVEAGGDVKVIAEGWGSGPVSEAEIMALAKDGVTNTANIEVVAGGDVKVIGKDGGKAQIEAIAKYADISNTANIDVTAEDGDVKVLGIGGAYTEGYTSSEALIGATAEEAENEGGPSTSNSANITIVANDAADSEEVIIESSEEDGDGDVLVLGVDGGKAEIEAKAMYGFDNTNSAGVDITADGDVKVKAEGYEGEYGDLSEAEIMALAKEGISNTADIGIVAGGDVVVLSKDGGQAQMEAIAKYADSTNTANIDITAEDGYVLVHGIGGYYYYDDYEYSYFTPSEALIGATAEGAGESEEDTDSTNSANITIVANDIVEEVPFIIEPVIAISEEDGEKDGDVMVIGVEGGIANITANAMNGEDNTAGVGITADGDVKVIAIGYQYDYYGYDESYAQIAAYAINEGSYDHFIDESLTIDGYENTADVVITAANVEVKGIDSGEVDVEAIAANIIEPYGDSIGVFAVEENGDSEEPPIIVTVNSITNTATVDITAVGEEGEGGDVVVKGECDGWADIDAEAYNEAYVGYLGNVEVVVEGPVANSAAVSIDAADDVKVIAKYGGYADIYAEAWNEVYSGGDFIGPMIALDGPSSLYFTVDGPVTNNADVAIAAADDVKVIGECGGEAVIGAETYNDAYYDDLSGGVDNTSNIAINTGGDVLVLGDNGDASIEAIAEESSNNTATILINTVGGDVKVIDIGEGGEGTAKIEATATDALVSNTADVTINATAEVVTEEVEPGVLEEFVEGGDVKVIAIDGGDAAITAFTGYAEGMEDGEIDGIDEVSNTANVTINATSATAVNGEEVETCGGDVKVIAEYDGEAEIEAIAKDGYTNTADVLICVDGGVKVKGEDYGEAEIEAVAKDGYSNTASVGIGARGEDGVEVIAEYDGEASIGSKAKDGYINTAETIVCTQGDLAVIGNGGEAYIGSEAVDGYLNDAFTGVVAEGDILVAAGFDPYAYDTYIQGMGGEAEIYSEAGAGRIVSLDVPEQPIPEEPSTANARTVAFSKKGGVLVQEITGEYPSDTASITADAYNANINTASVGVAAGADLSPAEVASMKEDYVGILPPGDVIVSAMGPDSDARIMSHAYGAYGEGGSNTADTVVCAPGEVSVTAYGESSEAKIKSMAGQWWDESSEFIINSATTQVYASDVYVDVPDRRGNGISALADGVMVNVPDNYYDEEFDDGRLTYCLTDDDVVAITDGTSTLIVDTYSNRKDCPTCPPCPCEEKELSAPVAPLPLIEMPRIEGCPGLMMTAALELGVPGETVQVAIGNALALNPSLQPCEACASLINAAKILRDEDGSRLAATVQAFNNLAPANAPMTPEMEASIAMAFENAPEGSQNALAKEYIDAFVQYASVLENQLGSPVGDSLVFVMGKYGAGVTESTNNNVAAYVMTRLQGI